jgi:hypothetical protein
VFTIKKDELLLIVICDVDELFLAKKKKKKSDVYELLLICDVDIVIIYSYDL